ncbi:MAG: (d)CMP kinase [Balneolaceae bacterium]
MIIVIDGPAGSGKSSTAKALSEKLDLNFLDSGALYRAVTFYWLQQGQPSFDQFFQMLPDVNLDVDLSENRFIVLLNSADISEEIRSSVVSENVSDVASQPEVRKYVNRFMRNLVKRYRFIADGRDLGTAVFPDADLKFFMIASIEERAKRRYTELKNSGQEVTLAGVEKNLRERDRKDQNRRADPLKKADDAIEIDTTGKTFKEQVDEMSAIIIDKLKL